MTGSAVNNKEITQLREYSIIEDCVVKRVTSWKIDRLRSNDGDPDEASLRVKYQVAT